MRPLHFSDFEVVAALIDFYLKFFPQKMLFSRPAYWNLSPRWENWEKKRKRKRKRNRKRQYFSPPSLLLLQKEREREKERKRKRKRERERERERDHKKNRLYHLFLFFVCFLFVFCLFFVCFLFVFCLFFLFVFFVCYFCFGFPNVAWATDETKKSRVFFCHVINLRFGAAEKIT